MLARLRAVVVEQLRAHLKTVPQDAPAPQPARAGDKEMAMKLFDAAKVNKTPSWPRSWAN